VHGSLFGRKARITPVHPYEIWISPRVRALTARHQLRDLAAGTAIAPVVVRCSVVVGIGLFLSKQLVQGLAAGLFGRSGAELQGGPVSVARVPGVVAGSVQHCVLGTVTLEELTDVITSGHLLTSELAASPLTWQAATGRFRSH
jgi:hypothetical protein